jgi:hypothetical protein
MRHFGIYPDDVRPMVHIVITYAIVVAICFLVVV